MNRFALALTLSLSLGACAAVDGNFMGGKTPVSAASKEGATAVAFEPMSSVPPAPIKEDVPSLLSSDVWVPGYYQPVAGNWLWHQGQVRDQKDGYKLIPASYREQGGKVYFTPPNYIKK